MLHLREGHVHVVVHGHVSSRGLHHDVHLRTHRRPHQQQPEHLRYLPVAREDGLLGRRVGVHVADAVELSWVTAEKRITRVKSEMFHHTIPCGNKFNKVLSCVYI